MKTFDIDRRRTELQRQFQLQHDEALLKATVDRRIEYEDRPRGFETYDRVHRH